MDIVENDNDEHLPYDVTMFWEFFRWERYKIGCIYLQCFPNGKLYAGQTINFKNRMKSYCNNVGSNLHHSRALRKHGWHHVKVLSIKCPWYILDTIETFLIEYYDLMNPKKGYNKTSGGRKNWHQSEAMRKLQSVAQKASYAKNPHRAINHSIKMTGRKHSEEAIKKMKKPKKDSTRKKMRKPKTDNHRANISKCQIGKKNHQAKNVCIFGNIYDCMQDASDVLRPIFKLKKKNFIKAWKNYKCYKNEIFILNKDMYEYMIDNWFYY
ncbi:GIY-YIG catalytic domain-containing endonuclease [Only Syngen Nebraska virus 5]|uniref:GIY-YIG catalytic domain-containing endonuclease n=1 Tax=Only Syngen Nebraska virus 5 TaxID=1917232 RepID=UPI000901B6AF|nr:GIY-YIG catalytic domain-containing endonuclease [Only Syngen Nebraska virus 5]APC25613.1 GIY-YIG catalytic domain-containing endonuclease [Only Syngen Nebraska virus 5]